MELDQNLYDEIVRLCEEGDELSDEDRFDDAIEKYKAALDLLPSPKIDWEASSWIYIALGDTYFILEKYEDAKNCFYNALNSPDGYHNPLILMRLGQSLVECEEVQKAKEYLLRAYMLDGSSLFEEDDKKYLKYISEHI
ncbi:hypothetical protein HOO54_08890 [Bacillus sp. WMMC1349]|uniref:tetratricopeptide repeat protein n=1 Tax=Bacillus sp. WMMC1349 TaxID=2736254 RepID=UPI001553A2C4|nr:hypothetical protein [Bacillus sp. WMMC1349]NPC92335.1 hypothetical protein [Bacillus sp. WMMC1349]